MARMARLVVPHYPHHVTQRGNRRQKVFFDDSDYVLYTHLLADACRKSATQVLAYCLMPNHVHFVMVPQAEDGLRATFGEAHRRYTRHINFREGWQGHLWQERFHSTVMDEPHLRAAVRYVELNPVRAGLCAYPWQWQWSSAMAHMQGQDDMIVRVAPMLERIPDWKCFLQTAGDETELAAFRQHARTGRPLGSGDFIAKLEQITNLDLRPGKRGPGSKDKKSILSPN